MIREITPADIPWVVSLGTQRYRDYDAGGGLEALAQAMRLSTAIAWRSEHGFLVGNIVRTLWAPKVPVLHILAFCVEEGHHWDAVELLRDSIRWARERGCAKWFFNSDTEHRVGPLARRIGARLAECYVVDFRECDP